MSQKHRLHFIKRANWILSHIVRGKAISGAPTSYTNANKSEKSGYKARKVSKVSQGPYNLV